MSSERALRDAPIHRRGLMLVLSSPSGAGKTTLSRLLLEHDREMELSVSVTTRPKRPAERDGVDYHFVDHQHFRDLIERQELGLDLDTVFDYGAYTKHAAEIVGRLDQIV